MGYGCTKSDQFTRNSRIALFVKLVLNRPDFVSWWFEIIITTVITNADMSLNFRATRMCLIVAAFCRHEDRRSLESMTCLYSTTRHDLKPQ